MAKYEVLKPFYDTKSEKEYQAGDIADMTVKRFEEIEKTANDLNLEGPFLQKQAEKK